MINGKNKQGSNDHSILYDRDSPIKVKTSRRYKEMCIKGIGSRKHGAGGDARTLPTILEW